MKRLAERKSRKAEQGSVLAMSAISMLALLLATGLTVDVSHFYTAKGELQNAADAAALAAASQLNSTIPATATAGMSIGAVQHHPKLGSRQRAYGTQQRVFEQEA
jgi:Flp pilus assembly protein TadG